MKQLSFNIPNENLLAVELAQINLSITTAPALFHFAQRADHTDPKIARQAKRLRNKFSKLSTDSQIKLSILGDNHA